MLRRLLVRPPGLPASSAFGIAGSLCRSRMTRRRALALAVLLAGLIVFCEFFVYYAALLSCTWPVLPGESSLTPNSRSAGLRVLLLADPHLLGWRQGHWFDKLRREWQMERAFQTSLFLHQPQMVVILGDVLDEGKWADDREFQHHVERFRRIFRHPDSVQLLTVVGNHDIGFHYDALEAKVSRFRSEFGADCVQLLSVHGVNIVLVNSIAFEGDGCSLCQRAQRQLADVAERLDCAFGRRLDCNLGDRLPPASRPLLLQHFPLFRLSEAECPQQSDSAPESERYNRLRPRWECLSESATRQLLRTLRPRLAFSGHTHWSCVRSLTAGGVNVTEYTVPSYSWRNINTPSFLLLTVSPQQHAINKCYMPAESFVIGLYKYGVLLLLCWYLFPCLLAVAKRLNVWRSGRKSR